MFSDFLYNSPTSLVICGLFIFIMLSMWLGSKLQGIKYLSDKEGFGPIESSLLGLLALILAFTFSATYSRYDERRKIIVEETNDIGTAILRIEMYPDSIKPYLRKDFKEYVEARIDYYKAGTDDLLIQTAINKSELVSKMIWKRITDASKNSNSLIFTSQMIPAVNNMIDIATSRDELRQARVPSSIKWVLLILILTSSLIIGINSGPFIKKGLIKIGFAVMICLSSFLILDLDKPRTGLITMENAERKIDDLLKMFD